MIFGTNKKELIQNQINSNFYNINCEKSLLVDDHIVIFSGKLFNLKEIKNNLMEHGKIFKTGKDEEVILKYYLELGNEAFNNLLGEFIVIIIHDNEIKIFRDPLGLKPFFYAYRDNNLYFASKLSDLLPLIGETIVDNIGLCELLGMGPGHTPGKTVYKDVFELRGGYCLTYKGELEVKPYFKLIPEKYTYSQPLTVKITKDLVESSIDNTLEYIKDPSILVSGGLDSSVISSYIARKRKLDTISMDYENSNADFKGNDFLVSHDQEYVKYLLEKYPTNHETVVINNKELANVLGKMVELRDYPGMADVDSVLYLLLNKIQDRHHDVITGEISDEIFGGYPWYYRDTKGELFPWLRNLDVRLDLLKPELKDKLNIKEYITDRYHELVKEVPLLDEFTEEEKNEHILYYLNVYSFLPTLIYRNSQMALEADLSLYVPFGDMRLIKFLYNVPFKYKFYNNQEKALLREAFKDLLPVEILNRKKSPFPKTMSPIYKEEVKKLLKEAILDEKSILHDLFDIEKVNSLLVEDDFDRPWYGQLMTKPQLMAYLYQIHYWGKKYNIKLNIKK